MAYQSPSTLPTSEYRPDIDGLRAIAVLSVILYHLDISFFSGGYTGVDVFFVISGFLITGIIDRDISSGVFSLKKFYARRFRRLMPAFMATMAMTCIAGFFLLSPQVFKEFGDSLFFSALALSNINFYSLSGYFDSAAELKPLLHTWSLAVEEQFYFIWPALLFLLIKYRKRSHLLIIIFFIGLSSHLSSIYVASFDQDATFFLTPFRIGEFFIGAVLALIPRIQFKKSIHQEITLVSGLFLIFFSFLKFDHETRFPGNNVLIPCIGTALVILGGQAKYSGHLINNGLAIFIGKISYSLYLIHWPVIVFYKYFSFENLTSKDQVIISVFTILISLLLYYLVESPLRYAKKSSQKYFILGCCGILFSLAFAGQFISFNDGFDSRQSAQTKSILKHLSDQGLLQNQISIRGKCYISGNKKYDEDTCLKTDQNKRNVLVIGDSYAAASFPGLKESLGDSYSVHLAAASRCRPLKRVTGKEKACGHLNDYIYNRLDFTKIDIVLLIGGFRTKEEASELYETVQLLQTKGVKVFVIGPPYTYKATVPEIFARYDKTQTIDQIYSLALPQLLDEKMFQVDEYLKSLKHEDWSYISLLSFLCTDLENKKCTHKIPDTDFPVICDKNHISADAAAWIYREMKLSELIQEKKSATTR